MNVRPLLVVNSLLIAAMVGATAWIWSAIPEGARLPVHWNIEGQADRLGSKAEALFVMPGIAIAVTLGLLILWRIDPRRRNIEASGKLWNAVGIGVVALLAYVHGFLVLSAMGRVIDIGDYLIPAMALLFIVTGNYLGKTRSNWFAGVRTPWTLSSDYSWSKTHRLAGRLFVGSGLVTLLVWFFVGGKVALFVMIATILATAIASVVASYFYWRDDPARTEGHANGEA